MSSADPLPSPQPIRFRDVFGVFVLGPDDVQFRTGSLSGPVCMVSDPRRRGLLGPVIHRLLDPDEMRRRPWNEAEVELLDECLPELAEAGVIETDEPLRASGGGFRTNAAILQKPLSEARIAVLGHGILGQAVTSLIWAMPSGPVTIIASASVGGPAAEAGRVLPRPRDEAQWAEAIAGHDWVVAAQDCFEPEELAALNKAALQVPVPWSLVCFDGYEGWIGPTFVPGQTACFSCFRRRLFAGIGEIKYVFTDPAVKMHRLPSPSSVGPETGAWVSLITSIFALELLAATQGRSFTFNQMLIVHRLNLTFQREAVLRLPRCRECSSRPDGATENVFAHMLSTRRDRE
jgi:bacteriocin biosynthesis cyclodehydratase domain-containing protein